jgi:ubiquinone biosynthesis protein
VWLFDVAWALTIFFGLRLLAARLLAVRIGLFAALVAGGLGIAAGLGVQRAVAEGSPSGVAGYATFAALSLLTTMAVVAALGLVARPHEREPFAPGSTIPHPLRALRLRIARSRRYLSLLWLAARYGLGPLRGIRPVRGDETVGVALRDALQEAGGIFIKFGQMLSARTDLVPTAIALELSSLQDDCAPLPVEGLLEVVSAELGRPVEELFDFFDQTPLAAASIAQVHRACLHGGDQVVVKIQRPEVERLVERDLDILLRLASTLEARAGWARRIGSVDLARGFAQNLAEELDFRVEAQNMAAIGAHNGAVRTPAVHRQLSTRRVLVEEWIDGQNLRLAQEPLDQLERTTLARSLLDSLLSQIFDFGVFHADPHAGNVLLSSDGRLVLLDFGSVGRLDTLQRSALAQALAAIARRRPAPLRDALVDLATAGRDVDLDGLERALARFFAQRLGPGMEPGAEILNDLLGLVVRFGLALDPQLAGVFRALVTLEGTLRIIDPTFNVVDEARRYAAANRLGAPRRDDLREQILDDLLELLPALRKIPRRLDRVSDALEHGELSLRISRFADPRDAEFVSRLANRSILAFFSASIGIVGVLLLSLGGGPEILQTRLDVLIGYLGLIAATVLGLRVIVAITREPN